MCSSVYGGCGEWQLGKGVQDHPLKNKNAAHGSYVTNDYEMRRDETDITEQRHVPLKPSGICTNFP